MKIVKRKGKEWLKRYLPAEIVGTVTAVTAASIFHAFSDNLVLIAYAGSVGEAVGFYSTTVIQRILQARRFNIFSGTVFSSRDLRRVTAGILLEFGPAGLIDGLILRPLFMYLFPRYMGNFTLGIVLGKLAGDITFYCLVILSYELKKRHMKTEGDGRRAKD